MVDDGIGSGDSDLAALGLEVEAMTNPTLSPSDYERCGTIFFGLA